MNIQELIIKLQEIAKDHPDATILVDWDREGDNTDNATRVDYDLKDNTVFIAQ